MCKTKTQTAPRYLVEICGKELKLQPNQFELVPGESNLK